MHRNSNPSGNQKLPSLVSCLSSFARAHFPTLDRSRCCPKSRPFGKHSLTLSSCCFYSLQIAAAEAKAEGPFTLILGTDIWDVGRADTSTVASCHSSLLGS